MKQAGQRKRERAVSVQPTMKSIQAVNVQPTRETNKARKNKGLVNNEPTVNLPCLADSKEADLSVQDTMSLRSHSFVTSQQSVVDNPPNSWPINPLVHSQTFVPQKMQGLSEPNDFMAAAGNLSSSTRNIQLCGTSLTTIPSWSAMQDLIDLNFGYANQYAVSDVSSSVVPREARRLHSATELSHSSNVASTAATSQSFSSGSSDIERHENIKPIHDRSNRVYDADFLKMFSSIRTIKRPFRPEAAPIARTQIPHCRFSVYPVSLLDLPLDDIRIEPVHYERASFESSRSLNSIGRANSIMWNEHVSLQSHNSRR